MDKDFVGMVDTHCEICGNVVDSCIAIDKHLRKTIPYHSDVLSNTLCKDCSNKNAQNYIALVVVANSELKDRLKHEDAIRTGTIIWMKRDALEEMFNVKTDLPMSWIDKNMERILTDLEKKSRET